MKNDILNKRRISADLCSCVDEDKTSLHMEFKIPGVKKKDIHLKMNSDSFSLRAQKDDVEYVSTGNFCCPVAVKNSEADYENGLLLINIPLVDPWDNAYDVPIH